MSSRSIAFVNDHGARESRRCITWLSTSHYGSLEVLRLGYIDIKEKATQLTLRPLPASHRKTTQPKQLSSLIVFLDTCFLLTTAAPLASLEICHPPRGYIESGELCRSHLILKEMIPIQSWLRSPASCSSCDLTERRRRCQGFRKVDDAAAGERSARSCVVSRVVLI